MAPEAIVESSRPVIIVFVLAAAGAGFFLWRTRQHPAPVAPVPVTRPAATAPVPPPPVQPPAKPAIENPITPEAAGDALPDLDGSDGFFQKILGDLLGKKGVGSFLMFDGFARRIVATVNNLDGDTPAAQLWPVNRTAGRLEITGNDIAAANTARYAPFVRFVEGIDTARAVALYRRTYPLLQKAYEDLGFSGKYFNDRVVAVIDHLLATPDVVGPIKVKRAAAAGSPPPGTTGELFLYEDAALEARSSGQKILLRMGGDNASRLKAKLAEIRRMVARGGQ
jgi:hypothetical protein